MKRMGSGKYLAVLILAIALQSPALARVNDVPDMPYPAVGMCSATLGDTVYLIGGAQSVQGMGFLNLRGTSVVQAFDMASQSWINGIARLNTPRVFACAATVNDSIYVMGGVDSLGHVLNTVEVYNPAANQWQFTSNMKFARKGAAATTFNSHILVFGGGDSSNELHTEVEAYSPATGAWRVLPEQTIWGRAFHHVARIGNAIYIFGGLGANIGPLGFIEKYVPTVGVVSLSLTWNEPRAFFGAITRNDSVYVISGYGSMMTSNEYYTDVQVLDFAGGDSVFVRRTNEDLGEDARRGFVAAVSKDGKIYLFGGLSQGYKSGQVPVASVTTLEDIVTAVTSSQKHIPSDFRLTQNYPNPFNPTTKIDFDVPSPGSNVRLEVFDILGRQVATLVNGFIRPGSYSIGFNGANLPSGTYIYRLQSANQNIFRKMVLLK